MKNLKIILIGLLSIFLCGLGVIYFMSDEPIKQEVVLVKHCRSEQRSALRKIDESGWQTTWHKLPNGEISPVDKWIDIDNKDSSEYNRILNAKYALITSYKDHAEYDFGSKEYIDSIKVISYDRMVSHAVYYKQEEEELKKLNK